MAMRSSSDCRHRVSTSRACGALALNASRMSVGSVGRPPGLPDYPSESDHWRYVSTSCYVPVLRCSGTRSTLCRRQGPDQGTLRGSRDLEQLVSLGGTGTVEELKFPPSMPWMEPERACFISALIEVASSGLRTYRQQAESSVVAAGSRTRRSSGPDHRRRRREPWPFRHAIGKPPVACARRGCDLQQIVVRLDHGKRSRSARIGEAASTVANDQMLEAARPAAASTGPKGCAPEGDQRGKRD